MQIKRMLPSFIHFSAEKDLLHCAVLAAIVREICSSFTNVGNAVCRGTISSKTSLALSMFFLTKVRLASEHSISNKFTSKL